MRSNLEKASDLAVANLYHYLNVSVKQEICQKVKSIIAKQLNKEASLITLDADLRNDLGANQMDIIEIMAGLQKAFKIQIPYEVTEEITTVEEAVDYIAEKVTA